MPKQPEKMPWEMEEPSHQDIIRAFCHLCERVRTAIGHDGANDCFCGEGGFWPQDDALGEAYRDVARAGRDLFLDDPQKALTGKTAALLRALKALDDERSKKRYDGTPKNGYRNDGKVVKVIFDAVDKIVFGRHDFDYDPAATLDSPRFYWIGRQGAVVCNQPIARGFEKKSGLDEEEIANLIQSVALDAAKDWAYYGGFLVCESCCKTDAERIVAALNFIEGTPDEIIRRAPFNRLMPSHAWNGANEPPEPREQSQTASASSEGVPVE